VYEGHCIAGVGQEVVLDANLEEVGHREVFRSHLVFANHLIGTSADNRVY
jgi:hypothetical protein